MLGQIEDLADRSTILQKLVPIERVVEGDLGLTLLEWQSRVAEVIDRQFHEAIGRHRHHSLVDAASNVQRRGVVAHQDHLPRGLPWILVQPVLDVGEAPSTGRQIRDDVTGAR